jgi:hypothetical protein
VISVASPSQTGLAELPRTAFRSKVLIQELNDLFTGRDPGDSPRLTKYLLGQRLAINRTAFAWNTGKRQRRRQITPRGGTTPSQPAWQWSSGIP